MLIYVHTDEADAAILGAGAGAGEPTRAFCDSVLSAPAFLELCERHFVLWAADLGTPAGLRIARQLGLREGPALAVVAYGELVGSEHSELRALERMPASRCRTVEAVVGALGALVERHEPLVVAARAERSEREMARMIRADQVRGRCRAAAALLCGCMP